MDQYVMTAGDLLLQSLRDALSTSQAGVLIWSKQAADSAWVQKEFDTLEGLATKKPDFKFVVITLDGTEPPVILDNRIHLDFSSYPDGPNGGDLLQLLHALSGVPFTPEQARFADKQNEEAKEAVAKIAAAVQNGKADRLLQLAAEGGVAWDTTPMLGCKAAEALARLGKTDSAIELLGKVSKQFPHAIRPKQLYAFALARRGKETDLDDAQEILGVLYAEGEKDPETLGIYARTWMDQYTKSGDQADLQRSRDLYAEAFKGAPDDYYTGINAAAKSVFLGTPEDLQMAADFAAKVQAIVGTEPQPGDYWKTATIGEVFLIRKDYANAARLYDSAVRTSPKETGSHQSTWTQACRLMAKLAPTADERAAVRKAFSHLPD